MKRDGGSPVWIAAGLGSLMLASLGAMGCREQAPVPATAIVVAVMSDLGNELAEVEMAVAPGDANPDSAAPHHTARVPTSASEPPLSLVVTKGMESTVVITLRGLDRTGSRLVVYRARVTFADGKTLRLPVFLGRACRNKTCGAEKTCYPWSVDAAAAGSCQPIPAFDERDLEPVREPGVEHAWAPAEVGGEPETGGPSGGGMPDGARSRPDGVAPNTTAFDAGSECDAVVGPGCGCRVSVTAGAPCDILTQCGCDSTETCILASNVLNSRVPAAGVRNPTTCVPPGDAGPGEPCVDHAACDRGLACVDGLCKAFCREDEDCGGWDGQQGVCTPIAAAASHVQGVAVCSVACGPADACPAGTVCADVDPRQCIAPRQPCPPERMRDGNCDEPEGSAICAEGTDVEDCCRPPTGGACELASQCGCDVDEMCSYEATTTDTGFTIKTVCDPAPTEAVRAGQVCRLRDDKCEKGHMCVGGLCQRFCETDADCAGRCRNIHRASRPLPGVHVCDTPCDRGTSGQCPNGSLCAEPPKRSGVDTDTDPDTGHCRVPNDPCPGEFLGDGVCDEPEGTGRCAEGTDAEDCCDTACCPRRHHEGPCNVATQCGCAAEQMCIHRAAIDDAVATVTVGCVPASEGTIGPGQICRGVSGRCAKGYSCIGGLCAAYCLNDADCGDSVCASVHLRGVELPDVRTCRMLCDPTTQAECPTGSYCQRAFPPETCRIPDDPCPNKQLNDGACDEPEGTRLCAEGTDLADCGG